MNTAKENAVVTSLGTIFRTEKDALEKVCTGIQSDNTEFHTSISSEIAKLHEDLTLENKITDEIAIKTEKAKVLSIKLTHANKHFDNLLSEKAGMKSCIADVNAYLNNFIKTHDSLITIYVGKHLVDKLRPVFAMLNRLDGVSEFNTLPKQGGDTEKPSTKNPRNQLVLLMNTMFKSQSQMSNQRIM